MGITDIYKNYKEKKAQKKQNGVQTAEQLWEDTQQKYNIACEKAEELSSHLEQGIKSNAKISESELDMISQTAKDTFKEINEIKFNKMFPRYKQIEAMVIRYSMFKGMGSVDAITKIIEEGKTREPMFDADDILLPYLLEKKIWIY